MIQVMEVVCSTMRVRRLLRDAVFIQFETAYSSVRIMSSQQLVPTANFDIEERNIAEDVLRAAY
jgi:hypothetical protein